MSSDGVWFVECDKCGLGHAMREGETDPRQWALDRGWVVDLRGKDFCPQCGWTGREYGAMFERFTDRARKVLVLAQEEARRLNHSLIGTEHLLLGLVHEGDGIAGRTLASFDLTLDTLRHRIEETLGSAGSAPPGSPPFTPRTKKVLELALREANQLNHRHIGTEHLLLGLLRQGDGVAAQVLVSLGVDLGEARQRVIRLMSGSDYRAEPSSIRFRPTVIKQEAKLAACSFCDRQPSDSGRIVVGTDAFICEHCIRRWASIIDRPDAKDAGKA